MLTIMADKWHAVLPGESVLRAKTVYFVARQSTAVNDRLRICYKQKGSNAGPAVRELIHGRLDAHRTSRD